MRLVVNISTGAVVHRTPLITEGGQMTMPSAEAAMAAAVQATGLDPSGLVSWPVPDRETAEALLTKDLAELVASIEAGAVVSVAIDPDYTPPTLSPDPVQTRLEALEAAVKLQEQAVAANLLATAHDRKWLAQKETAKLVGIPYIQEHPECSQEEVEEAVVAALTAAYPGQAIVVSGPGIIQSYADEALARGYLSEASFLALRDLVAASTPAQVQAMLAVL